jgi:hypothetical protein
MEDRIREAADPQKRGRPRKSALDPVRTQIKIGWNRPLELQTREAARASGRSVTAEVEYRLSRSFAAEAMPATLRQTLRDMLEEASKSAVLQDGVRDPLQHAIFIAGLPILDAGVLEGLAERLSCPRADAARFWLDVWAVTMPYIHTPAASRYETGAS